MEVAENHHSAETQPERLPVFLKRCGVAAALLLLLVLFYWKLLLTNQYTWLESPDLAYQLLPWFQFQAGEWHLRHFPLWEPGSWGGQPLLGQGQPGSAYPPNWLLFLFPLKNGWIRQAALHWYFVLIHYLAALTAYAFCRDLGRSRGASVVGGLLYALGGYVGNWDWPQMINGAVWTPLAFMYLFRAARGERALRSSLLSGFFMGFGWLAGHHQMNLLVTIAALGLWAWLCVSQEGRRWRMATLGVISMAMVVLTGAFQTLPMFEYGRLAIRWVGTDHALNFSETVPYFIHGLYALKPAELLGIIIPGATDHAVPYLGVTGFTLAVLGLILAWRDPRVRWLSILGIGGILYSLGPSSLLHGALYALFPLVEKARVPGAGTLLFSLGFAPLAAFGIDLIPEPSARIWSRRAAWTLCIVAAFLFAAVYVLHIAKLPLTIPENRLMIAPLAAILGAAVLTALRTGGVTARAAFPAAIVLVLFELNNVATYTYPNRNQGDSYTPYLSQMGQHGDIVDFLRRQGPAFRVEYDDQAIPYNFGDWHGVDGMSSYLASVTENVMNFELFSRRAKEFWGIRYYIGKAPQYEGQQEVFQAKSGLKVFEIPSALPRTWVTHRTELTKDRAEAQIRFNQRDFNPLRTSLFVRAAGAPPETSGCPGVHDETELAVHRANYVRINVKLDCSGMVVLTDTWYPGWRATVDGKAAPIYEAFTTVRAVEAGAGSHVVEMRYRPMSVILGAALSLAAALIAAVAAFNRRRDGRA